MKIKHKKGSFHPRSPPHTVKIKLWRVLKNNFCAHHSNRTKPWSSCFYLWQIPKLLSNKKQHFILASNKLRTFFNIFLFYMVLITLIFHFYFCIFLASIHYGHLQQSWDVFRHSVINIELYRTTISNSVQRQPTTWWVLIITKLVVVCLGYCCWWSCGKVPYSTSSFR